MYMIVKVVAEEYQFLSTNQGWVTDVDRAHKYPCVLEAVGNQLLYYPSEEHKVVNERLTPAEVTIKFK